MATATLQPYRTYTPRPFQREERENTTILFGGLHWRAEQLIQSVFENLGYKAQVLPVATKEDLLAGLLTFSAGRKDSFGISDLPLFEALGAALSDRLLRLAADAV